LDHYKLQNFKSKILVSHENNWLFNILFHDYLDGQAENEKYIKIHRKDRKVLFIFVKTTVGVILYSEL